MPATTIATTSREYARSGLAISAIQIAPAAWISIPVTISGRSPIRSASIPAIGPTTRNVAVHGTSRRPAPSAS
jgi:hypothetical protein